MPKSKEVKYFNDCFIKELPRVKSYFGNVVKGQNEVYTTPFARGESTTDLISRWNAVLKSIEQRWPSLYQYEIDLANKVGPMSVMKPLSERMSDIENYYEDILLPSKPISHSAIAAVLKEWGKVRGLHVRSQVRTNELMKKSTNSGSPFFTKRRNVSDETIPCRVNHTPTGAVTQWLPAGDYYAAAILGWRGQEGGPKPEDTKQRVVWMFPYAVNVSELQVYQPLIESAQNFDLVPAWVSMDSVDRHITEMFDTKSADDLVVCTDFSKFDQHFNDDMQDAAEAILSGILNHDESSELWLGSVFPIKYKIPLIYDVDRVKFGPHGMGSGSGGTNADETLVHRALQYEAAINDGQKLNLHSQCLGDDGILTYPGITVESVVETYSAHGQEMNVDKQYASTDDCVYLRRWHHKDYRVGEVCVGVYSTMRALGRLRYLERFQDPKVWGPVAVALRQLSILENVKWHPLREEFVQFCMKRDKYRLGIDIPNFLDDIERIASEMIDNMPDFMGYTKSQMNVDGSVGGIGSWWIVNYLKSLK